MNLLRFRNTEKGPSFSVRDKGILKGIKMSFGKTENSFVLCFVFLLMFGLSWCRVVTVPSGPLVRVAGQMVSIRCDVSDYEGPLEQDFEWDVIQAGKTLRVVSTLESTYPDSTYKDRVKSGIISVKRLSESAAELRITKVSPADSGVYRCSTPSTDSSITGNYFDDVELKVIGDNLKVTSLSPLAVVSEGSSLVLRCNATRDPADQTYLSVTWSIRGNDSTPKDIITLGPDGKITPGAGSAKRLADGGLQLDSPGGGAFGLTLSEAQLKDQGTYTCMARQWVLEGSGAWQSIMERSVTLGDVKVTPARESLKVSVEKSSPVNVGDSIQLTCSVSAADLQLLGLEVTWLFSPSAVATGATQTLGHMGRDGVVANVSGLAVFTRIDPGTFKLLVPGADQSNSGFYSCRVQAWIRQGSRSWYQAAEKVSNVVEVQVTLIGPELKVALSNPVVPHVSGDPMELDCKVTDVSNLRDGRLGVSWQQTKTSPADLPTSSQLVATLDQDGNLLPGDSYRQQVDKGLVVLSRMKPDVFRLQFLQMSDVDMGSYSCSVSAWTLSRDGIWVKAREMTSNELPILLAPRNPMLTVEAKALREAAMPGATFEMSCQVRGQDLEGASYSVLIQKAAPGGAGSQKIISLSSDSVLRLEDLRDPDRLDDVVLQKVALGEFHFRLAGSQASDQGQYYCDVEAWTRNDGKNWTKAAAALSNRVGVAFSDSGSYFNVSARLERASLYPGETATMFCAISVFGGASDKGVTYEVSWRWSPVAGLQSSQPLISWKGAAVTKFSRCELDQCRFRQLDPWTYRLNIDNVQHIDAGEYYCKVTSWKQASVAGSTKGYETASNKALLTVEFSVWDSLKIPLLYGCGIALVVGLIAILLGYVTARWCCRIGSQNPRSNKMLIDMEMD